MFLHLLFLISVGFTLRPSDAKTIDDKLSGMIAKFSQRVKELNENDLLDGVVLIKQGDQTLLHEMSKEVVHYNRDNKPAQFMIGSVSKTFTAVAVLMALYETSPGGSEDEKVALVKKRLHEPIITFLPPETFAWGTSIPSWAHEVTLHHLLSHTSGIVHHIRLLFEAEGYDAVQSFLHEGHGPEYIIQKWGNVPLAFTPGSQYSYSNLGYELLAKVVSHLTNMPFEKYPHVRFFEPRSLNSTVHPTGGTSLYLGSLNTYQQLVPEQVYLDPQKAHIPDSETLGDIAFAQGSGGIVSTAEDLAHWGVLLHDKKTILPTPLYDLLIQPRKNSHGYGIFNRNGIYTYTGKLGSYVSCHCFIPQQSISIIMLFHIDQDEAAFIHEHKNIDAQLQDTIPDETERNTYVAELLTKKYPPTRGAAVLIKNLFDELEIIGEAFNDSE